jgi:peptidoglycan/xylan/chitin deacetylase (PgdA/CDA1 family)
MTAPSLRYYSSLRPFGELFATFHPLLTYHHVGSRPPRVRLKGLYVSPKLFSQKIAELKSEGYETDAFGTIQSSQPNAKRVFLTFDDGFADVFENALPVLRQHRFRSIQFLVADLLGKTSQWQASSGEVPGLLMDKAQVKDWLGAGQEIGSHTSTHPRLIQISPSQAREEISGSKKKLEDTFGIAVEHFCYPYGDWKPAVRDILAEVGYKNT